MVRIAWFLPLLLLFQLSANLDDLVHELVLGRSVAGTASTAPFSGPDPLSSHLEDICAFGPDGLGELSGLFRRNTLNRLLNWPLDRSHRL